MVLLGAVAACAQNVPTTTSPGAVPALPAALDVPHPGPQTASPYAPQPILPGGIVVPLYAPGSPMLNTQRVHGERAL